MCIPSWLQGIAIYNILLEVGLMVCAPHRFSCSMPHCNAYVRVQSSRFCKKPIWPSVMNILLSGESEIVIKENDKSAMAYIDILL